MATSRKRSEAAAGEPTQEPPPGWVDVEMSVAARKALYRFRYLTESQRAALRAGVVYESGEYMVVRITTGDATLLAGDLTHAIVHGQQGAASAELMNEAAEALEAALGIR